jgi:hypothetical protein
MPGRFLLLTLIILTSCSGFFKKKTERTLARVYNEYLFESDLKGVVQPGTSGKDSLMIVKAYIDNWVRQRLILHQAEKNLGTTEIDFTKQLENYRNSLVIFEYENALIRQKLDTIVTDEEISNYYNTNQNTFLVTNNIIRVQYVKLRKPGICFFLTSRMIKTGWLIFVNNNRSDILSMRKNGCIFPIS